jgi:hypothetical protein
MALQISSSEKEYSRGSASTDRSSSAPPHSRDPDEIPEVRRSEVLHLTVGGGEHIPIPQPKKVIPFPLGASIDMEEFRVGVPFAKPKNTRLRTRDRPLKGGQPQDPLLDPPAKRELSCRQLLGVYCDVHKPHNFIGQEKLLFNIPNPPATPPG